MSQLFSPITLRDVTFNNRLVVAPMCQYLAEDGNANDWHLMHLGQMSMGAGGLVFTEATHVSPEGRITPKCLGLWSDDNERTLKRVVDFCKTHGVARMGIQLAHAGRKASNRTPLNGAGPLAANDGAWQTLGPSAVAYGDWPAPRALDDAGLAMVKQQFVTATERSARLGFDTAQLHCAHGYLMHQFLSPLSNRRNDGYGGTIEGRMRFPLEVFEACRAAWPENLPLGVRVSASDWVDGGLTVDEIVEFAKALKEKGCDYVDVSSGGNDPGQKITLGPGYQVPFAERVRQEAGIPVMAVGLITDPHQAEAIVSSGKADFVAIARGAMDNPRWAWHAARALGAETEYPPQYIRCRPDSWRAAPAVMAPAAE
ncbi:MAG: NADH:flavin oxidoreductase/NADH oxidase [Thalassobaculum sp.]|uniref:NADH:flavin oxidoreductase/NADH oxidase n=1 Tax=Thalassobaculum sp. TaxID=2022740 RepID=UPI0032EAD154